MPAIIKEICWHCVQYETPAHSLGVETSVGESIKSSSYPRHTRQAPKECLRALLALLIRIFVSYVSYLFLSSSALSAFALSLVCLAPVPVAHRLILIERLPILIVRLLILIVRLPILIVRNVLVLRNVRQSRWDPQSLSDIIRGLTPPSPIEGIQL
jgi:hypothetical protein